MSVQSLRAENGAAAAGRPAAAGPPPGVAGGPPADAFSGMPTGIEGREEDLGRSVAVVLKTLRNVKPYEHDINDALIKARLQAMQFAKDHGLMEEYVAHDVKTMTPLTSMMKNLIEKSGQAEIALIGIFDRTACHYQLCLENESAPGIRRWRSPFGKVLDKCRKLGQFDLTEEWIHENWTRPRLLGYAKAMGVDMRVSHWQPDGWLSAEVA